MLINATQHEITIVTAAGTVRLPGMENSPRVVPADDVALMPILVTANGQTVAVPVVLTGMTDKVIGLPPVQPDTHYVVSRVVLEACPERTDLLIPHRLIRDSAGRVIGCEALALTIESIQEAS